MISSKISLDFDNSLDAKKIPPLIYFSDISSFFFALYKFNEISENENIIIITKKNISFFCFLLQMLLFFVSVQLYFQYFVPFKNFYLQEIFSI